MHDALDRAQQGGLLSGDTAGGPGAPGRALEALTAASCAVDRASVAARLAHAATARVAGTLVDEAGLARIGRDDPRLRSIR